MADPRSQMNFGQMASPGQVPASGYGQLNMMQQQQFSMMQQHQQQQQQQQQFGQRPMMMHAQQNAMMAQAHQAAMVGQQQFSQQQVYMGQMQQQMPMGMYMFQGGQFIPAPGFVPVGAQGFTPPPYTAQMAHDYRNKEKLTARQAKQLEEQKKRAEAEHRARMFQEQQQRLKEFSAIGGRKMDADSLIKHIIGPDVKSRPAAGAANPPAAGPPASEPADEDDGFGEFMQGPSVNSFSQSGAATQQAQYPANKAADNKSGTHSPAVASPGPVIKSDKLEGMHRAQSTATQGIQQAPPTVQTPPPAQATPTTQSQSKEEKKDLEKMMFASCDLTAPQKARTFQKRTLVKDAPKQVRAVTYQASDRARQWDTQSEPLSDLFTVPAPEPPPPAANENQSQTGDQVPAGGQGQPGQGQAPKGQRAAGLPAWCMGETPLPELYSMVLQASVRDGNIQTELLYPILVRSGLPREVLGAIWSMANRTIPGQLLPPELCAVLALVALAQNNIPISGVDMLFRLPGPPIPNLGQNTPPAEGQTGAAGAAAGAALPPGGDGAGAARGMGPASGPPAGPTPPAAQGTGPIEDDFADFQEATAGSVPPSDSFGDFTAASPIDSKTGISGIGAKPMTVTKADTPANGESLMAEEDRYSIFKTLQQGQDDSSGTVLSSGTPPLAVNNDLSTNTNGAHPLPTLGTTQPDVALFMGRAPASAQPVQPTATPDFADFQSASENPPIDFAKSKDAGSSSTTTTSGGMVGGENHERLSVLKQLVSDKKLYEVPPVMNKNKTVGEMLPEGQKRGAGMDDDWDEFASVRDVDKKEGNVGSTDGFGLQSSAGHIPWTADAGRASNSTSNWSQPSEKPKELFPAEEDADDWGGFTDSAAPEGGTSSNWASFSPVRDSDGKEIDGQSLPAPPKAMDWGLSSSRNSSDLTSFSAPTIPKMDESKSRPSQSVRKPLGTDSNKKLNYFTRNLDMVSSGVTAGTGMSPLDFQPPDLPDGKDDDEDEDDFDKFGTFRGVDNDLTAPVGTGISSLGAPFGGMDDLTEVSSSSNDMFGYASRPRTHAAPQKDPTDSISISSNEFTGWKVSGKAAKESDTQSVSSLDLTTLKSGGKSSKDGSPAGGDSQSVSSLEFGTNDRKMATPADERSVASLELKTVSTPDDAPFDGPVPTSTEDNFGEFSSASDGPRNGFKPGTTAAELVQRPRAASELLRTGDLPTIGDRYSSLAAPPDEGDRHVTEWARCLARCRAMLEQAAASFTSLADPALCEEVLHSRQGTQYIQGVVEIYRVVCRITEAMRAVSATNEKLVQLLKSIDTAWLDLVTLLKDTPLKPSPGRLDFSRAVLKAEEDGAQERACGVCLLNVDARTKRAAGGGTSSVGSGVVTGADEGDHKLTYGGRQYHASCANFWVNCVDLMLPALKLPELL